MFTFGYHKVEKLSRHLKEDKNIPQNVSLSFGLEVAPSLSCPLFLELLFQNDIANILKITEKRARKLYT